MVVGLIQCLAGAPRESMQPKVQAVSWNHESAQPVSMDTLQTEAQRPLSERVQDLGEFKYQIDGRLNMSVTAFHSDPHFESFCKMARQVKQVCGLAGAVMIGAGALRSSSRLAPGAIALGAIAWYVAIKASFLTKEILQQKSAREVMNAFASCRRQAIDTHSVAELFASSDVIKSDPILSRFGAFELIYLFSADEVKALLRSCAGARPTLFSEKWVELSKTEHFPLRGTSFPKAIQMGFKLRTIYALHMKSKAATQEAFNMMSSVIGAMASDVIDEMLQSKISTLLTNPDQFINDIKGYKLPFAKMSQQIYSRLLAQRRTEYFDTQKIALEAILPKEALHIREN